MPIVLQLTDWMAHASLSIEASSAVTFVVGKNRRGKTAIRDAAEFLFLGTAELRGVGTKKALAQLCIRDGADSAEVVLESALRRIRRTVNRKGEQSVHVSRRDHQDLPWTEERVAVGDQHAITGDTAPDLIRASLEPTAFYALPEARRRELLIGATSTGAPKDAIVSALLERVPPADEDERERLVSLAGLAARAGFRVAEETASEERRKAKRDARAIPAARPPSPTFTAEDETSYSLTSNTVEEYEERLQSLREAIRAAELSQASDLGLLEGQLAEAEVAWRALADSTGDDPDPEAAEHAATANAALASIEARLAETDRLIVHAKASATLSAGEWTRPKLCPAVPSSPPDFPGMVCPVKDATFAKAIEAAAEASRKAQSDLDALQQLRNEHLDARAEARKAHDTAAAALEREIHRSNAEREQEAKAAVLEARMSSLTATLTAAREAAKSQAAPSDVELQDLRDRAARGERILAAKRAFDAATVALAAAEREREEANERAERWDEIAKALAPTGIESELGGGAREAFEADLADLAPIVGAIELDESFGLWTIDEGARRHFSQLSESHRLALGIAVQHAFAKRAGLPFLVTDAIDRFDAEWKVRWFEAAREIAPKYQGGVLGLAATSATPAAPPEGASTVWLKPDGSSVVLGDDGF